jgi:hypothetical protein
MRIAEVAAALKLGLSRTLCRHSPVFRLAVTPWVRLLNASCTGAFGCEPDALGGDWPRGTKASRC